MSFLVVGDITRDASDAARDHFGQKQSAEEKERHQRVDADRRDCFVQRRREQARIKLFRGYFSGISKVIVNAVLVIETETMIV